MTDATMIQAISDAKIASERKRTYSKTNSSPCQTHTLPSSTNMTSKPYTGLWQPSYFSPLPLLPPAYAKKLSKSAYSTNISRANEIPQQEWFLQVISATGSQESTIVHGTWNSMSLMFKSVGNGIRYEPGLTPAIKIRLHRSESTRAHWHGTDRAPSRPTTNTMGAYAAICISLAYCLNEMELRLGCSESNF